MIPGFYEVISGPFCSFQVVKKAGDMVVIAKKSMKKDLTSSVLVDNARSYFSNF